MHYVAASAWAPEKPDLVPIENWNRFSLLHIFDRLELAERQAVICLTVVANRRDYSRYQGLEKRTRKYV